VLDRAGTESLVVDVEVLGQLGDQPLGVLGVVDREGALVAEPRQLPAQDPHTALVEGGDPHPLPEALAEQPPTRSAISPAALFVKVIARTSKGLTPWSRTRCARRWVSTRVLPEPAPATTRTGPSTAVTAARWASFSPTSNGESMWASVTGGSSGAGRWRPRGDRTQHLRRLRRGADPHSAVEPATRAGSTRTCQLRCPARRGARHQGGLHGDLSAVTCRHAPARGWADLS
jgi:hypothetical protein